jgi:purine-binding chemotaxis protein CheW
LGKLENLFAVGVVRNGTDSMNASQYLIFDLSNQACALPLSAVRRILPMALLSTPPSPPPFLEGILNWKGEAIPVIRASRLFQLPDVPLERYTPLILLKKEPMNHVALLADRIRAILDVPPDQLSAAPPDHSLKDCVVATFTGDGQTVFALSPDQLLLKEESLRVDHFRQEENRRLAQAKA